jgi:hypothetical protein
MPTRAGVLRCSPNILTSIATTRCRRLSRDSVLRAVWAPTPPRRKSTTSLSMLRKYTVQRETSVAGEAIGSVCTSDEREGDLDSDAVGHIGHVHLFSPR